MRVSPGAHASGIVRFQKTLAENEADHLTDADRIPENIPWIVRVSRAGPVTVRIAGELNSVAEKQCCGSGEGNFDQATQRLLS